MHTYEGFSTWRRRLWPVHGYEHGKLFALLFIKFCVSFNYTILHATKDTLIVTTKGSGAEVIPILKGGVVLVCAFLFMLFYTKLSNRLSRSGLFYATLAPFAVFFVLYGFVLYPYRDVLCPHQTADWLVGLIGKHREHWVVVYRYWMDSLFFLMAELWGGVVIALLFWGFANRINTISEASRFYTMLSVGGHVGIITAGPLMWHYAHAYAGSEFCFTIQYFMSFVTVVNVLIMGAYWWTNRYARAHNATNTPVHVQEKKAAELPLSASLKYVLRSPYLGCIALMVIGYGISVNMVEVLWKANLKIRYPDPHAYQAFMGIVSSITGCVSLFLALCVGGNVVRRFGWYVGAQITPVVLGVASCIFLGAYFFHQGSVGVFSGSFLMLIACGAFHNIACKSMKYCLFDPTKEMAYIPLDEEAKIKGKAAVDLVAARFGKSGSSWIQIGLMELVGAGSILSITSYLAPFILIAIAGWAGAVYILNRRFGMCLGSAKSGEI